ncbi:MAG: tetratricopeptide repeat protein [Desulfatiglandaceae bacterium]
MGLFKNFFKPNAERHEQRGDECVRISDWGRARLAYEAALDAVDGGGCDDPQAGSRIQEKLDKSVDALSREHIQTARDLVESGYADDARELLELARGLTRDTALQAEITRNLKKIASAAAMDILQEMDPEAFSEPRDHEDAEADDHETFTALLGALPEDVQSAYLSYGPAFQAGYVALNQGDFESAARALSRAMEAHPEPESFIPLELGTALLNLHRLEEAQPLIETFLAHHPDALPGYQVCCEILWEKGDFDRAEALLGSCPEDLHHSWGFVLLRGETLSQAGRFSEAAGFYETAMNAHGRHDAVMKALAAVYETLGRPEKARGLYQEIMNQCRTCHTAVDPFVLRKLADIGFELGEYTPSVLESYLSLAQDDPGHRAFYFNRISRIYAHMGNDVEARRFEAFARKAQAE